MIASAAACLVVAVVLGSMDVTAPHLGRTKVVNKDVPVGAFLAFQLLAGLAVANLVYAVRRRRYRRSSG